MIVKLIKSYQKENKKRNMTNHKSIKDRNLLHSSLAGLFDVAHPDLEENLKKDKIRANLGVTSEHINFLNDQRGERNMSMGSFDTELNRKKAAVSKRKFCQVSSTVTSDDNSRDVSFEYNSRDVPSRSAAKSKRKKGSSTVTSDDNSKDIQSGDDNYVVNKDKVKREEYVSSDRLISFFWDNRSP